MLFRSDDCDSLIDEDCDVMLSLKVFIEGFYSGGGSMNSPMFNSGIGLDPNNVDTITVLLYDQFDPTMMIATAQATLHADGTAMVIYPGSINGGAYYIAILTRNGIETWSKLPVTFGATTNYDFAH